MILSLMKYYRGYLKVRLTGFAPERFINLCSNHNILIWNLECVEGAYEFLITVKGYRQVRPFVKKSKTKLRIIKKFGLPFFLYRHRKRKVFFAGILCFGILLYSFSIFIWDIHIEGNYTYTEDVLMTFLKEQDIVHGKLSNSINCEEIEKLLRNEYMEITWVSARISGTRLLIQIKENYGLLTIPEKDEKACDIVAQKDGIITEIITRSGVAQVKIGDVVTKGQVLVSGVVPIVNDAEELVANRYVHSDADIKAKTVYNYEDSFDLLYKIKTYTGNEQKACYIRLFDRTLSLYPLKNSFVLYDKVNEEYQLKIIANFYLPIYAGLIQFQEYGEYESQYRTEEAFAIADDHLNSYCQKLEENDITIEEKLVKAEIGEGICKSTGVIKTIEAMGEVSYITEFEEIPQIVEEE